MPKKILNGIVVSNKPNKTITVMVERKYQHPVLKKVIKARKKYSVHDEENKFKNGDKVLIRFRARAKGRAAEIMKPYSNVTIILTEQTKQTERDGAKG